MTQTHKRRFSFTHSAATHERARASETATANTSLRALAHVRGRRLAKCFFAKLICDIDTHTHTQLRLASWILIGVVQFCPPLCFSQDPKTRRPQHTIGPLPVLDYFSASGSRTHFIATGRSMKAASATCFESQKLGKRDNTGHVTNAKTSPKHWP